MVSPAMKVATLGGQLAARDKAVALGGLLGVAALAWFYTWREAVKMSSMSMDSVMMATAPSQVWTVEWISVTFIMWTIMMIAMMLPSAAPAMLLYGSVARKNRERGTVLPSIWTFAAGYLAAWTAFSLAATILQAALQSTNLVTGMMVSGSTWLTAGVLLVAGVYQWLPAKDACLEKCRDPLQFFLFRWRPGVKGAFLMGAEHGAFCTGCCWALMLLLFTAGVMNLLWVALIAGFVLVEKLLPGGYWTGRLAGVAMVATAGIVALA